MSSVGAKIGGCGPVSFLPKTTSQLLDSNHTGIDHIHRSWSRRMAPNRQLEIVRFCNLAGSARALKTTTAHQSIGKGKEEKLQAVLQWECSVERGMLAIFSGVVFLAGCSSSLDERALLMPAGLPAFAARGAGVVSAGLLEAVHLQAFSLQLQAAFIVRL